MLEYKKKLSLKRADDEFDHIAGKIQDLDLPKGFSQFILYTFSELLVNVQEHSQSKDVYVEIEIKKNKFELIIEDNGIGFRKSYFQKSIYPKDDFSAIEFALSGLSTKEGRQRGFGLFSIRKFIKSLNGKMIVKTGNAVSLVEKNKIEFKMAKNKKSGVAIIVQSPISKIDFYKII